jgi:tRNA(Ile2) C34 agmatinyltransferase TiaS
MATTTPPAAAAVAAPRREITTELIAARAYIIWEQQGRPHGRDMANWLLAESQLKQEVQSFTA